MQLHVCTQVLMMFCCMALMGDIHLLCSYDAMPAKPLPHLSRSLSLPVIRVPVFDYPVEKTPPTNPAQMPLLFGLIS